MSLWLWLGAMTMIALALLLWPLLRRQDAPGVRRDYELTVYRAQLEELEREQARGLIGPREAEAARLEIQRRMLAADAVAPDTRAGRARNARPAALATVVIGFPLLCAVLYAQLGSPTLPGQPFGGHDVASPDQHPGGADLAEVEAMIARLEQQLAASPDDMEGWFRLGSAYAYMRQYEQAVEAYRRAIELEDDIAALHAALAEALSLASNGIVTERARQALQRALEIDPQEPRARFYHGLELAQRGEQQRALDVWVRLAAESPADAPWLPALREQVTVLAADMGLDPEAVLPEPLGDDAGPPGQGPAIADLPPQEQEAMILRMVEDLAARLEQQPDDLQGWRMLARSYQVLGQPARAAEASAQAARLAPGDVETQRDHANALLALQPPDEPLAPALIEQMRRVHDLDDTDASALFFLGKAAEEQGDRGAARGYWQELLAGLPEEAPERAQIEQMLDQLRAVN